MRIKALVKKTSKIYRNEKSKFHIKTIKENELIHVSDIAKNGTKVFYKLADEDGFIEKENIKIIRDEDFYYSSHLLKNKVNRSKFSRFNMLKNNDTENLIPKDILENIPEYNKVKPGDSLTVINAKLEAQRKSIGMIKPIEVKDITYDPNALINPINPNIIGGLANKGGAENKTAKINWESIGKGAADIGLHLLENKSDNKMLNLGINVGQDFLENGNLDNWGNKDLGNIIGDITGNSMVGDLLSGASFNNIKDGSFFSKKALEKNAINLVTDYANILLSNQNFVMGFNLSSEDIMSITGFGISEEERKPFKPNWLAIGNGIIKGFNNRNNSYSNTDFFKSTNMVSSNGNYYYKKYNGMPSNEYISNLDERIKKYFTYKGSQYKLVSQWAPSGGGGYYKEESFATPTLSSTKDSDEVQFHQDIYNNTYSDFQDALSNIKDNLNLNIDKEDWFVNFNRFRLIHPDTALGNSKGYIFFTRPDLNLDDKLLIANSDIGVLVTNMNASHPLIIKELMDGSSGNGGDNHFMPLLSNRCTGLDIQDESMEIREYAETIRGWKLNFGTNLIKSKASNTVTASFIDDNELSIYLLFKIWLEYISSVSRGICSPRDKYIKGKQLDYANSIYYFLTGPDGESIIFWTKFTGCIPTNIPSSNFSDSIDSPIKNPKYSISWQYTFKRDYDPATLVEFNDLTGSNFKYSKIYNEETGRSVKTISGAPFVEAIDGGKRYKLRFRPNT